MASTTSSPPHSEPPGGGDALRRARESAGLSLREAAEETRISAKYLGALEEDARPDAFPSAIYARFFMREYAEFLGLDPDPLLRHRDARFAADERDDGPDLERIPVPPRRPRHRLLAVLLSAASVITLAALGLASLRSGRAEAPAPSAPPPVATSPAPAAASPTPTQEDPPAPAPARGIRVVLTLTAPSWVEATADGERRVWETVPRGERLVLRARRTLDLVLGNAGGVRLLVNGRLEPTGEPGEVARLSFARRGDRVVPG